MTITWRIITTSPGRTKRLDIDEQDLAECATEEERTDLIDRSVKDAFDLEVSYVWEMTKPQRGA